MKDHARRGEGAPPRRTVDERHLREIVGGMTDGVILIGTDQSIEWANAPALAMHGVADIGGLGSNVADYRRRFELRYRNRHKLPEGHYPMERVMAGEAFDEVVVEVAPAGSNDLRWVHRIRSLVLGDDDGVPNCLVLLLHDETERYSAEERFEKAFAANPAPALILRLDDLRHLRVNRGFLEMTGFRDEDVVGRSIYEVDVLEGASRRELAIERLREGRTVPQMEAVLQLPGGGEKCVIVAGQPIDIDGIGCMLFTFADLDGRRHAEAALRQSEERFETAFRLSPVPTLVATRDNNRVLLINDAFARETGFGPAEVLGRDAVDLQLWSDPKAGATIERLLRDEGRVRDLDLRLRTADGGAVDCLVAAEAVEIHGQRCVLVTAQNVSERKRTHVEVAAAIEAVFRDTSWLTDAVLEKLARARNPEAAEGAALGALPVRAREVLDLVCGGADDGAIAAGLGVSRNTVRNHVAGLFRKTGVRSRAALIVWGRERGVGGPSRTG